MYLQITNKCNMSCLHCCFSCTADGENMSLKVFRKALELCDHITLGGGEPTVHPKFWQMLGEAISYANSGRSVWLATNGKKTNTALALAKMAQKGVIGCRLSIDDFHEPIDEQVVKAFTRGPQQEYPYHNEDSDYREMSNPTRVIKAGRAKNWDSYRLGLGEVCPCEGFFVKPNGDIRQCGCEDSAVVGTVFDPPDWGLDYAECFHGMM